MTTGKEIVDEFHQHNFFVQSMADEWLAKRIDDAILSALALETEKRGIELDAKPVVYDWDRPPAETAPRMPKYVGPAKKQRANRK